MAKKVLSKRAIRAIMLTMTFFMIAVSGCDQPKPVKIGFMDGISGGVADIGIPGLDAVQMAVEQCNEQGGIHGRPVQIFIKNDRQDPGTARQAAHELIEEGVCAVIGPMTSNMALVVVPVLDQARIPAISPTVTTERLTGYDDYFFRLCSTTREYAVLNADFQVMSGNMRRIAVAYDTANHLYCESWLKSFTPRFTENGGEILATIPFGPGQKRTFSDIAHELLAFHPDGLLFIANANDSALLCQQIRKTDRHIKITLSEWGSTRRLFELGGKAVEGVTTVQPYDRDCPNPRFRAFREKYLKKYHREPGFSGVYSYDAAQTLLTALKNKKEEQGVKEALLSLKQFDGLQRKLIFDEFGDMTQAAGFISVARGRQFVFME